MAQKNDMYPILMPDWVRGFPGAVTVSDLQNRIVYLNEKAAETWADRGGKALVGTDLQACHNEHSRGIIDKMLAEGGSNVYTIEKQGKKKLIFQTTWQDETGQPAGLVELSIAIPMDMPHFIRG